MHSLSVFVENLFCFGCYWVLVEARWIWRMPCHVFAKWVLFVGFGFWFPVSGFHIPFL